ESVKAAVMKVLARSFHDTAVAFARGTKLRPEGRAPYCIYSTGLVRAVTGRSTSSARLIVIHSSAEASRRLQRRVSLVTSLQTLTTSKTSPALRRHQQRACIQDPQFIFYIRNLSWPQFAEEVGFISLEFPGRYDFALSFAGSDRAIAEALFTSLQAYEVEVFYDRNEQHRILAEEDGYDLYARRPRSEMCDEHQRSSGNSPRVIRSIDYVRSVLDRAKQHGEISLTDLEAITRGAQSGPTSLPVFDV